LRDVVILRAVAASWITDYPHEQVDSAQSILLDARDALHRVSGRATDRLSMQEQAAVSKLLGVGSDDELLRQIIDAGRAIASASDLTWHRVQRLTRKQPMFRRLRAEPSDVRVPLADGVIAQNGEVFLARDARSDRDPSLLLRAAAAAAQAGMRLAPETVDRLAHASGDIPQPWPRAVREAFVSFLGAGPAAVPVWEALDNAGLMSGVLPYWQQVRSLPQRNALHMYTVDRHQLETAVSAAAFTRDVHRPDLLLVAALFHDIGKGRGTNHSGTGAALMSDIAPRLGFDESDTDILCRLVQHHLLLAETATRRDLDDPSAIAVVVESVETHETLDLLHALTKADSQATGPGVWSAWKEQLLQDLVDRAHAMLAGEDVAEPRSLAADFPHLLDGCDVQIEMQISDEGVRILVGAQDRLGLLSTVAGVMTMQRLEVRAATLETVGARALQAWFTTPKFGDAPSSDVLIPELRRALAGAIDVDGRVRGRRSTVSHRRGFIPPPPRVTFLAGASERADVLEVRAHDAPALLWRVAHVLASVGITVLSARVSTLGSEVIDVLYVVNADGSRLTSAQQSDLANALRSALTDAD
jgi:[protein-PII] uridylyltransferase